MLAIHVPYCIPTIFAYCFAANNVWVVVFYFLLGGILVSCSNCKGEFSNVYFKSITLEWVSIHLSQCAAPHTLDLDTIFGSPGGNLVDALYFIGLILLVFGLMGVYSSQIEQSGYFGFLGFLLTMITTSIALSVNWLPENGEAASIGMTLVLIMAVTGLLGYILLGIGSWKANQLPRWATILWPIGWGVSIFSMALVMSGFEFAAYLHLIGFITWGIGGLGAGVRLWST